MAIITEAEAFLRSGRTPPANFAFESPQNVTEVLPDRTGEFVEVAEPTVVEEAKAAFEEFNIFGSMAVSSKASNYDYDPKFNYLEHLEGYEEHESTLSQARNGLHLEQLKSEIDRQSQNKAIIEEGGASAVAWSMGAAIADPTIAISGASVVKGVNSLRALKGVATSTGKLTAGVATQEAILQNNLSLRTHEESLHALAATALLSGMLSTAGAVAFRAKHRAAYKKAEQHISDVFNHTDDINIRALIEKHDGSIDAISKELDSVGAARVSDEALIELGYDHATMLKKNRIQSAKHVEKVLKKLTPTLDIMQSSPFLKSRELLPKYINAPLWLNKNEEFIKTEASIEKLRELHTDNLVITAQKSQDHYEAYKKRMAEGGKDSLPLVRDNIIDDLKRLKGQKTPETSFNEQVREAMIRGDTHAIPEIDAAAKEYRKFFDKLANDAVEVGIWKEIPDIKTAESYFSRIWDKNAINQDFGGFEKMVKDYVREEARKAVTAATKKYTKMRKGFEAEIAALKKSKSVDNSKAIARVENKIKALRKEQLEEEGFADELFDIEGYVDDVTENITNRIMGLDDVNPEFDIEVALKGPLKGRKFLVSDIAASKYLVKDVSVIAQRYARVVGTEVEFHRKFGTSNFDEIFKDVTDEYKHLLHEASPKEAKKLRNRYERERKIHQAYHDILRGNYDKGLTGGGDSWGKKLARTAMQYNFVRMLGGVIIASIPDVAKLIQYNGVGEFYNGAVKSSLSAMNINVNKLTKAEIDDLKYAGLTNETLTNSRLMSLGDLTHNSGASTFERYTEATTRVFSKMTGLTYWNDYMQKLGGIMSQRRLGRMVETVFKGGELDKVGKTTLAHLGIDESTAKAIGEQFKKYATREDDHFVPNSNLWDNADAARAWRHALKKDVESIVIRKDIGDAPLLANSAAGQVMLQFKSFIFASTSKTLLAGLQRGDRAQIESLSAFIAMGAMTYVLRSYGSGREPDLSPENLIFQGIDRSGILGVFMEVNNIYERLGGAGISRAFGGQQSSKFASRSIADSIFGPSLGTVGNLGMTIRNLLDNKELNDTERRNLRKLAPFNNLFYLQWLMSQADKNTRTTLGY